MKKWNLVIDVALCNNCALCQLATMDEYAGNRFAGYSAAAPKSGAPWIRIERVDRGEGAHVDVAHVPKMCNHCDNAPCGAGHDEAIVKRRDGIVLLPPEKAAGRRDLPHKCPYGAIHWNEELQLPQLWGFDAHLLDAGSLLPRCAHACPTRAMAVHHVADERMAEIARQDGLQVLQPERGARPRVYYRNLHRATSRFVAGTVVTTRQGRWECLEGACVELSQGERTVLRGTTDCFGDFKFDGLPSDDRDYEIKATCEGHEPVAISVHLDRAGVSLGQVTMVALRPEGTVSRQGSPRRGE